MHKCKDQFSQRSNFVKWSPLSGELKLIPEQSKHLIPSPPHLPIIFFPQPPSMTATSVNNCSNVNKNSTKFPFFTHHVTCFLFSFLQFNVKLFKFPNPNSHFLTSPINSSVIFNLLDQDQSHKPEKTNSFILYSSQKSKSTLSSSSPKSNL